MKTEGEQGKKTDITAACMLQLRLCVTEGIAKSLVHGNHRQSTAISLKCQVTASSTAVISMRQHMYKM